MFMFMDQTYLFIVLIPSLVIGGLAALMTKLTFAQYSRIGSSRGYTGAEAAHEMLRRYGISGVRIEPVRGMLTDHYNPMTRTLCLSEEVYGSRSLAAIGVACHEAGHAIQHARSFSPLWLRSALVPATNICSTLYIYLLIVGMFVPVLGYVGLAMCGMGLVFAVVTLPVEWDASRRAKIAMREVQLLAPAEINGAAAVLNAAFLTYMAAVATSLLTLVYWAIHLGLFGSRRD